MRPTFLVIGAMKSATSSLCDMLGRHPDVFMCRPKEPDFFCNDTVYSRGWPWYEAMFEAAGDKAARGEGSTSYTKALQYPHCAERIAAHLPGARLIYIVRHPLERIESHWMHDRLKGRIPRTEPFSISVRKRPYLIDVSLYWRQLAVYRQHFPDDRILVLFSDDFRRDPQAEISRCWNFLGLSEHTVELAINRNVSAERNPDGMLLRTIRRNQRGAELVFWAKRALPAAFRAPLRWLAKRHETVARPQWDSVTRKWVCAQVRDDAGRFLAFFNKPATTWNLDDHDAKATSLSADSEYSALVAHEWPAKYDLFGLQVSGTTYDESLEAILQAVHQQRRAIVSLQAVHAVVTSSTDPELCEKVNRFHIVAPDGQPVRWALNRIYGLGLPDRVYGPEMMLRVCQRAAAEDMPIYLYGGTPHVLDSLINNLRAMYPRLTVTGEAPPFRPLDAAEEEAMLQRVRESGARIVFIGLGCPKQDHFAATYSDRIDAVQICVGAAFDFHAGVKKMAPAWMQRSGLEWLFRLSQEPGRLWRRYFITNSIFIAKFARQWLASHFSAEARTRTSGTHSESSRPCFADPQNTR